MTKKELIEEINKQRTFIPGGKGWIFSEDEFNEVIVNAYKKGVNRTLDFCVEWGYLDKYDMQVIGEEVALREDEMNADEEKLRLAFKKLAESQKPIDPEIATVVRKRFWDLF